MRDPFPRSWSPVPAAGVPVLPVGTKTPKIQMMIRIDTLLYTLIANQVAATSKAKGGGCHKCVTRNKVRGVSMMSHGSERRVFSPKDSSS